MDSIRVEIGLFERLIKDLEAVELLEMQVPMQFWNKGQLIDYIFFLEDQQGE